jgi:hypothetical protein
MDMIASTRDQAAERYRKRVIPLLSLPDHTRPRIALPFPAIEPFVVKAITSDPESEYCQTSSVHSIKEPI